VAQMIEVKLLVPLDTVPPGARLKRLADIHERVAAIDEQFKHDFGGRDRQPAEGRGGVSKPKKTRRCWFCGEPLLGQYYDRWDNCGSIECDRETRDAINAERDEAHEQLDRDMGWDR
jgi:hypothetical protein